MNQSRIEADSVAFGRFCVTNERRVSIGCLLETDMGDDRKIVNIGRADIPIDIEEATLFGNYLNNSINKHPFVEHAQKENDKQDKWEPARLQVVVETKTNIIKFHSNFEITASTVNILFSEDPETSQTCRRKFASLMSCSVEKAIKRRFLDKQGLSCDCFFCGSDSDLHLTDSGFVNFALSCSADELETSSAVLNVSLPCTLAHCNKELCVRHARDLKRSCELYGNFAKQHKMTEKCGSLTCMNVTNKELRYKCSNKNCDKRFCRPSCKQDHEQLLRHYV